MSKSLNWRDNSNYDVGLYIVYEDLMDENKGPDVLRRIATITREAGFTITIEDEDISCAWYNSLGEERVEQYRKNKYDYNDYVPGFTKEQQEISFLPFYKLV